MPIEQTRTLDTVSMRDAYCDTLVELARNNENILAIEADVMASMGTAAFAREFPGRSINCGIQEANAVGVAAALSMMDYVPFFHAFGTFATRRAYDQVFLSCGYQRAKVKIIGGDAGVTASANGGTHMPLEDLCLMRAVPGMTVIEPADTVAIRALVPQFALRCGNVYMRCSRKQVIRVYRDGTTFNLGKANLLRDGRDVTIVASGIMVHEALCAAEQLEKSGITARVIDHFTIKPLDKELLAACARETGAVVTAENHNIIGGLGEAVAGCLGSVCPVPIERIGVKESFGEVGDIPYLMSRFHLTSKDIAEAALRVINRKTKGCTE